MTASVLAPRLLCFHTQKTSARTRFLCHGSSVLAFAALPEESALCTHPVKVRPHPAALMQNMARHLDLATECLRVNAEFDVAVSTTEGEVSVILIELTTLDPPFAAAEAVGAHFIALTEARRLPSIELNILRKAYEHILG